ncbi:hypothetical protein N431DRAFT_152531 [Stipitochalara longipes BDJ]|nr:hypothetical protein N431DRAFT_152531 [Stipitochalara longipes BDJ]
MSKPGLLVPWQQRGSLGRQWAWRNTVLYILTKLFRRSAIEGCWKRERRRREEAALGSLGWEPTETPTPSKPTRLPAEAGLRPSDFTRAFASRGHRPHQYHSHWTPLPHASFSCFTLYRIHGRYRIELDNDPVLNIPPPVRPRCGVFFYPRASSNNKRLMGLRRTSDVS